MPGAIDFHCSVACAASREERLSEKIAMRMDGLPRWMHEGMAAQGYTSFVACQRARAVPKKKGRLGSRPLQQIACFGCGSQVFPDAELLRGEQFAGFEQRSSREKKLNVAQILERKSRFLGKGGPRNDKWGIAARYAAVGARQDQAQPPVRGKQEWLRYRLGGDGDDFGFTRDF